MSSLFVDDDEEFDPVRALVELCLIAAIGAGVYVVKRSFSSFQRGDQISEEDIEDARDELEPLFEPVVTSISARECDYCCRTDVRYCPNTCGRWVCPDHQCHVFGHCPSCGGPYYKGDCMICDD
jgi:hypothetical protein